MSWKRRTLTSEISKRSLLRLIAWTKPLAHYKKRLHVWFHKTHQCKGKWEMPKKTLDFQPIKMPNSCKNSMNTRTRLRLTTKKIISWNKRWTLFWKRMQTWMSKSETPKKISDLVQTKWANLMLSSTSIRTESQQTTKSLILIVKESKN